MNKKQHLNEQGLWIGKVTVHSPMTTPVVTVRKGWESYRRVAGARYETRELRRAFYAGATYIISALLEMLRENGTETDATDNLNAINDVLAELAEFTELVRSGLA